MRAPGSWSKRGAGESVTAKDSLEPPSKTVVFNVGGRHFEVLRTTIAGRPTTRLARMVVESGGSNQPIYVDGNSDRFMHILDWYRFGEIHLPVDCSIGGVLCDARFLALPEAVRINGSTYPVHVEARPDIACHVCDVATANILDGWSGFDEYINSIVAKVRQDLDWDVQNAKHQADDVSPACMGDLGLHSRPKTRLILSTGAPKSSGDPNNQPHVWLDKSNVCNRQRLQVLCSELRRRGFECSIQGGKGQNPLVIDMAVPKTHNGSPWMFRASEAEM